MKFYLLYTLLLLNRLFAVGEAGAIFLLISPGASSAGNGEAEVAKGEGIHTSYFNPGGLVFTNKLEVGYSYVNWLPNLSEDLKYSFYGLITPINKNIVLGGNYIYLNLGEQAQTDEHGNVIYHFNSNMWALTGSFSTRISENTGVGVSMKVFQQNLLSGGGSAKAGTGVSTDFAFDVGYLFKGENFNFGLTISNMGPKITFIDVNQADPAPTNLRIGILSKLFDDGFMKVNYLFDVNKLLVASYPDMDWDGDGLVGGYDKDGSMLQIEDGEWGEYNSKGKMEWAHSDPWYLAVFTSWLDDWYLGGERDWAGEYVGEEKDHRIGGWSFKDGHCDDSALPEVTQYTCYDILDYWQASGQDVNGKVDQIYEEIGETNIIFYPELYAEEPYEDVNGNGVYDEGTDVFLLNEHDLNDDGKWNEGGDYNHYGLKEAGADIKRSFKAELIEMVYNYGIEFWFHDNVVVRNGFLYDKEGSIIIDSFGIGFIFEPFILDFGYTGGEEGHPRGACPKFCVNGFQFNLNVPFFHQT